MNITHHLSFVGSLACLSALVIGCATSNDTSPIVAPPETASVEAVIDPSGIESPPWALPETGDLPSDPIAASIPPKEVGDEAAPTTSSSVLPTDLTPAVKPNDTRFQLLSQVVNSGGQEQRVSMKLDRHSGQTWRLDPASFAWTAIAEASDSAPPHVASSPRYALQVQRDESSSAPTDTFMRMDLVTGDAWLYTRQLGAWKRLGP